MEHVTDEVCKCIGTIHYICKTSVNQTNCTSDHWLFHLSKSLPLISFTNLNKPIYAKLCRINHFNSPVHTHTYVYTNCLFVSTRYNAQIVAQNFQCKHYDENISRVCLFNRQNCFSMILLKLFHQQTNMINI